MAIESARYAAERGARHITLIPVRGGNGALERLASEGAFVEPTLSDLELALSGALRAADAVVTADTWDLERFATCGTCSTERIASLERMNETGVGIPPTPCLKCDARAAGGYR